VKGKYNKKDMEILADIWDKSEDKTLKCPQCGHKMIIVQVEPISDAENAYIPYDTVIECTSCEFKIRAESFTILGSVKEFDVRHIEIASWSPSGSRVISKYEHILEYEELKRLKESGELKEFLIVNKQVIQIIG
jgi:DNA-directed RNA polymerase subunit RPC12/RpoP